MISVEDARAIAYALDPSRVVRLAYRAAASAMRVEGSGGEDGIPEAYPYRHAAVVLDLDTGNLRVLCWHETAGSMEMPTHYVALAYADTALVEEIERHYAEGCVLPPSREVLEECVARMASADGIGVSWSLFESQLRIAYDCDPEYDQASRDG